MLNATYIIVLSIIIIVTIIITVILLCWLNIYTCIIII